jgi:8-oxo-dGTP diphosphatase
MNATKERPKVGVAVYIRKNGKVLLQRRKGAHNPGTWCAPGGHLEMFESWENCAQRETLEEAGIEIDNIRFITATNDIFPDDGKHYITIAMVADWKSGEARIMEPDKCDGTGWFAWNELPSPLAIFFANFIKTGYNPLEI